MRIFWFSVFFCCVFAASAAVDVEKTMKNMGFQYKQALETKDTAELISILDTLIELTTQARQAQFAADKAQQFQHGLSLVLIELRAAKQAAQQNDEPRLQHHLQQVDALRKEYHQQRKVSIWQLLFG
jgi:soluble cytochrome b562